MYLVIKNKFMSIRGSSVALDENKKKAFIIKGSWLSNTFTKKYSKKVYSLDKKLLFKVCNKRLHHVLKRSCIIYNADKVEVARISQNGGVERGFYLEGTNEKIQLVSTSLLEMKIIADDKEIGTIGPDKTASGKTKINFVDTLRVDFIDKENAPFLVAVLIAIDNINDSIKRSNKTK